MTDEPDVPAKIRALAYAVRAEGGRALLVGGCVRDWLQGRESKDWDVEIYGIEPAALRELLEGFGRVNTVGEAFTVYKLSQHIDVSLPRRERKQGRGHRGFVVEGDPQMSVAEAARRRDFTVNAILQDPLTSEIIDPHNGREDLRHNILRHVSHETFAEDSLRVLRAAQFAARFGFQIEPDTIALCRTIDLTDLPAERIWGEMEKLLLQSPQPATGLFWLAELSATPQLFPELDALPLPVSTHTRVALDRARDLIDDLPHPKRVAVMLATLCHSFGDNGKVFAFLDRLKIFTLDGYDVRAQTIALVREHRRPSELYEQRASVGNGVFRRLARQCELELLYRVARACALARNDRSPQPDAAPEEWFINRARELGVEWRPLAPLLRGRDLQELGLPPSPLFKRILDAVYEMQLDDSVTNLDEARIAAEDMIATNMYD